MKDKDKTILKARQILDIACGNEDAVLSRSSNTKFPMILNKYPEFKGHLK